MIVIEEKISHWQQATVGVAKDIAEACTAKFFADLTDDDMPAIHELERVSLAVAQQASTLIVTDTVLNKLLEILECDNHIIKESVYTSWLNLMPKLRVPTPQASTEISVQRLAAAAALGSLIGMLLLGSVMYWLLNMRDVGILIGGCIGSAGLLTGIWIAARDTTVRNTLLAVVGIATVFDLLSVFTSIGWWGLWKRTNNTGSIIKRLLVYLGIIVLLTFTKQRCRYDRANFIPLVRNVIDSWVNYGLLLVFSLATANRSEIIQKVVLDAELARSIVDLHSSNTQDLPLAAESVLREARRLGLDNISINSEHTITKRELRWESSLTQSYSCFGIIEEGDLVAVEEEPVIQNGIVIDRGQVRKIRRIASLQ